jgi:Arc/MetJ family transcription regulator
MHHNYVMRTTIDLNDALFMEAKRIATEQHTSLKAVVEDGLRFLLAARQQERQQATAGGWPVCTHAKPVPGIDLTRSSVLLDLTESP